MDTDLVNAFNSCASGLQVSKISDSLFYKKVKELLELKYVIVKNHTIYQTTKGKKELGEACTACECDPCDCDWGN